MITWTTEDDQLFINLEDKNHIFSLFFFLQSLPVLAQFFLYWGCQKGSSDRGGDILCRMEMEAA